MMQRIGLAASVFVLTACTENGVQSTPQGVVQKVFEVATSRNYGELSDLCAPEADQGIQQICDLEDASQADQDRFSEVIAKGSIAQTQIKGDKATVNLTGEKGKAAGKVFLAKKEGQWYMVSSE
ncbi:hypothetical protein [Acaryochloris sp. IP29b_bin.148]|uniref:hypothetical protein n=1 Tax=Acaryochloris sp. IP29b_bin.148 TaxID=2969218 RepID=UPI002615DFBF|nr:hypothetical protein [Acaryochloris sp. IP29b_bin.148]